MRRIALTTVRAGLGIGLLIYLIESGIIEPRALASLFLAWPISLAAIALVFVDLALMAWRLAILFRPHRLLLSWMDALRLTCIGSFFSNFLPGRAGGDLAKIFYASKENAGRRPEIIAILLFDRAVGLFSLLLLPLLMIPFFAGLMKFEAVEAAMAAMSLLVLAAMLAFLICIFIPDAPVVIDRWMGQPNLPGKALALRLFRTISAYRGHPGALVRALALAIAANLILIGTLMLAVVVVDPSGLEVRLSVLIPIGQVVNSLPLTPGGLGVGESAFQALFGLTGVTSGANALISWRIWNFIASLAGLAFYLRGFKARIPEWSDPAGAGASAWRADVAAGAGGEAES